MNTYDENTPVPIHHIDLYRLKQVTPSDCKALGLNDVFSNGISLIEWSNRLPESFFPMDYLHIDIRQDSMSQDRIVTIQPVSKGESEQKTTEADCKQPACSLV